MSLVANSRYKLIHEPPPLLPRRRAHSAGVGAGVHPATQSLLAFTTHTKPDYVIFRVFI